MTLFLGKARSMAVLLGATALVAPGVVMAHSGGKAGAKASALSPREAALLARLEKLEAEVSQLRADAAAARQQQGEAVQVAQAAASAATTQANTAAQLAQSAAKEAKASGERVAAVEKKPQPEGMRVGSTNIRIGGFLKFNADYSHFNGGTVATNTLGRDFYLPQLIPVVTPTSKATTDTDLNAKQTRLWLNLDTTVAGHTVKGYLETDFQTTASTAANVTAGGSQRTTNGYTLALRRAFVQFDKWTFGQDWSTFQNPAVLPESTDFVGAIEGTIFVRQPLVRYSTPLSKAATLHLSVENPESATATAGAAALVENGTDHLPDFTARLNYAVKRGEISFAALGRQVRTEVSGAGLTRGGFGGSVAGKIFLNDKRSSDLRFSATYGQNIGRYVGLNFAPDAVYVPATNSLADVKVFAALAAARVALSSTLRVNLIGSLQTVDYDGALSPAAIALYNKKAWSGAANLFYSPVKFIDLGIEYRHGQRELVNGQKGNIDRLEFAAKYNF